MNHRMLLPAVLAVLALAIAASPAGAQDTSPYVMGTWMHSTEVSPTVRTQHFIVNPTTRQLDVYAVVYGMQGAGALLSCTVCRINGNGTWRFIVDDARFASDSGTVKFFAFPKDSRKFDPNAVIGGFQQNVFEVDGTRTGMTEANLKAVTINSSTIGEFATIPPIGCMNCLAD
jgi:hypothetical protein